MTSRQYWFFFAERNQILMNVLNITHNPGNHVSQVPQDQSQYQVIRLVFVHGLDLRSKNTATVLCLHAHSSWRHTLATWTSCHFLHLQMETQMVSSAALASSCPVLAHPN